MNQAPNTDIARGLLDTIRQAIEDTGPSFGEDEPQNPHLMVLSEIQGRINGMLFFLDALEGWNDPKETDRGDMLLWRLRTILTPDQDASARDRYTEWLRGRTIGMTPPTYAEWYEDHVKPKPPKPSAGERFANARERLAGREDLQKGLILAWRSVQDAKQEEIVATMAEALVAGLSKG